MARKPARISISRKFPKLDHRALTLGLLKEFDAAFKLSAGVFVRTLAKKVNIQTGESFASLQPLAADTGTAIKHGTVNLRKGEKHSLDRITGAPTGKKPRGKGTGWALGSEAYDIQFQTSPRLSLTFNFSIPTFQLAVQPGTQAALDRAEFAMKRSLERHAFPAMEKLVNYWIKTGKVRTRSF